MCIDIDSLLFCNTFVLSWVSFGYLESRTITLPRMLDQSLGCITYQASLKAVESSSFDHTTQLLTVPVSPSLQFP